MPSLIQRVPAGLLNLLSINGGMTPNLLGDQVQPTLDLLQHYGLTQLQTISSSANPAEGTSVGVILSSTSWSVLYGCSAEFTKTATMTALRGQISIVRGGMQQPLSSEELGPFGATETGQAVVAFWCPYPILCPPGSQVSALPQILGTDASVATLVRAHFGLLG